MPCTLDLVSRSYRTQGPARIAAQWVALAAGCGDSSRAQRLTGGTEPAGVLSNGALQGMVLADGLRRFRRSRIIGTEGVSVAVRLTYRHAGCGWTKGRAAAQGMARCRAVACLPAVPRPPASTCADRFAAARRAVLACGA